MLMILLRYSHPHNRPHRHSLDKALPVRIHRPSDRRSSNFGLGLRYDDQRRVGCPMLPPSRATHRRAHGKMGMEAPGFRHCSAAHFDRDWTLCGWIRGGDIFRHVQNRDKGRLRLVDLHQYVPISSPQYPNARH